MQDSTLNGSDGLLLERLFPTPSRFGWQMELCERAVIELLARRLQPEVAIDLGTASGGSLSAVAPFAKKIFSLDVKHAEALRAAVAAQFPHCELVTGDSKVTLVELLRTLESGNEALEMVLIDGGHSREQVKADFSNLIRHRPKTRLIAIGHDSFNPNCRQGMLEVDWASSPWVVSVELDAVPGILWQREPIALQQWGGFLMVEMTHEGRNGANLVISQRQEFKQELCASHTVHRGTLSRTLSLATRTARQRRVLRAAQAKAAEEKARGKKKKAK